MGNCDSLVIANTMPRDDSSMDTNKTFKNHGITDYQGQQKIRDMHARLQWSARQIAEMQCTKKPRRKPDRTP
jgi:hypothetical protein